MTSTQESSGAAQIRQLIADRQRAICAKDIDSIMAHYSADIVVFNVKPPFQIQGAENWRREWKMSLSHFPASFGTEIRDLVIDVAGELAAAHCLWRFTGMPGQTWVRDTAVCRRNSGRWQIVHEHYSVPFDPETSKAVFAIED